MHTPFEPIIYSHCLFFLMHTYRLSPHFSNFLFHFLSLKMFFSLLVHHRRSFLHKPPSRTNAGSRVLLELFSMSDVNSTFFKGDDSSWPRTSRQRSHLRPPDLPRRPRATIFDVTVVSLRRARPRQSDRQPRAPVHDVPQWVNNPLQERGQPPKRFHIFYVRGFNSFLWFCSRLENQTSDLPVRVLGACSKIFVMG